MENPVALIIISNHNYDKNIDILEKIYHIYIHPINYLNGKYESELQHQANI